MNMQPWKLINDNEIDAKGFLWATQILQNKIIIIADDHHSTLTWLKYSLEDYGAIVYTFEHGKDALDCLEELKDSGKQADVLILDLIMNEIGGLEIARLCQQELKDKILFLTGCSWTSQEATQAKELGKVIQKPVGLETLVKDIMTVLAPDWENSYFKNKKQ